MLERGRERVREEGQFQTRLDNRLCFFIILLFSDESTAVSRRLLSPNYDPLSPETRRTRSCSSTCASSLELFANGEEKGPGFPCSKDELHRRRDGIASFVRRPRPRPPPSRSLRRGPLGPAFVVLQKR